MGKNKLSDGVERKFIEKFDVSDWEILTDSGYQPILSANKTIEYTKYRLVLDNGYSLGCADTHIVFTSDHEEVFVKDLIPGQKIYTDVGLESVKSVANTGIIENMYDLSVDSEDHRYYTNGILSHNSTTLAGYIAWYTLFNDSKNSMILANKMNTAKDIFSRVQFIIEACPKWLQQGVKEWNKTSFMLENGSKVSCAATSASAVRGSSISLLALDEFAFLRPGLADEFIASVFPTISSAESSKMIIVSTPNGMNHFYKMWVEAEQGINGFHPVYTSWKQHPKRTQAWADEQFSILGPVKFAQEVECLHGDSIIQLKDTNTNKEISASMTEAYRLIDMSSDSKYQIMTDYGWCNFDGISVKQKKTNVQITVNTGKTLICSTDHLVKTNKGFIKAKSLKPTTKLSNGVRVVCVTSEDSFTTLYDPVNVKNPTNSYIADGIVHHNCVFQGSSYTLISGGKLAQIPHKTGNVLFPNYTEFEPPIKKTTDSPGGNYVITVDTARGADLDSSAFVVFDINQMPYKIVAKFSCNSINTLMYPEVIMKVAKRFNDAFVLIETNDLGQQVADILFYDLEYENVYMSVNDKIKEGAGGKQKTPGIRTTKRTKAIGCDQLKTLVESDHLIINDHEILEELSTFTRSGTSYKAEEGKHDDLVMCLVMFGYLVQEAVFRELFDFSLRQAFIKKQIEEFDEQLAPIGFLDDGMPAIEEETVIFNGDVWQVRQSSGLW